MFISVHCYWGNSGAEPIPNDGLTTSFPTDNAPFDCIRPCARRAELGDERGERAGEPTRITELALKPALPSVCAAFCVAVTHPPTHSTMEYINLIRPGLGGCLGRMLPGVAGAHRVIKAVCDDINSAHSAYG